MHMCVCVSAVGQSAKLQQSYSDFLPDYFSLTEKPPEEFCLSPDASTSSSSCSSSQSHISVDLTQKRGEAVCTINDERGQRIRIENTTTLKTESN